MDASTHQGAAAGIIANAGDLSDQAAEAWVLVAGGVRENGARALSAHEFGKQRGPPLMAFGERCYPRAKPGLPDAQETVQEQHEAHDEGAQHVL